MERNRYETCEAMAMEISDFLKAGGTVCLALDSKWWVKRNCSPYEARIVKDAILYSTEFDTKQVLAALEKQGCHFETVDGLAQCFGRVQLSAQFFGRGFKMSPLYFCFQ